MKKLLHTLLIAVAALSCFPLQSCLTDDDTETVTYSDCAITSITLGTLKCIYHGTSSKGADSVYIGTYSAASCQFTIDQYNREIYNTDSLPAETDATKIVLTIGTKNGGLVYFKSATSDSITYHNATDSVDFTTNPRLVYIRSNDGTNTAVYKLKVNIHKESPKKMTWSAPYTVPQLANTEQLKATEWKTETKDSIVVKVAKEGNVTLYASPIKDGRSWAELTPNQELSATANIASKDGVLYTTNKAGQVCKSEDGKSWEAMDDIFGIVLGVSNGKLYLLEELDGANEYASSIASYDISTAAMTKEPILGADYCPLNFQKSISLCEIKKDNKVTGTTITGVTNAGPCVLFKAENTAQAQKWMFLSNSADQNLPSTYTETVAYGNYLVALSGGKFYSSLDSGRSWQERYYLYTPWGLSTTAESHLFADSRNTLWVITPGGTINTGKLNEVAW